MYYISPIPYNYHLCWGLGCPTRVLPICDVIKPKVNHFAQFLILTYKLRQIQDFNMANWVQSRILLSAQSARYELPMDMHILTSEFTLPPLQVYAAPPPSIQVYLLPSFL